MPRTRKAVSGPGRLSQRTDLTQPLRAPTGGPYGQRKQLLEQQRAAPLPAAPPGVGVPTAAPPGGGVTPAAMSAFGPTLRPGEPVTAGSPLGPGGGGPLSAEGMDTDRVLQVMFRMNPCAAIGRLLIRGR